MPINTQNNLKKKSKKSFKENSLLALFIFLNLTIGLSRFIIAFLNKSHDQKTINHITYGLIMGFATLLMFAIIFWNVHYRIASLVKCTNIKQEKIRNINNYFQDRKVVNENSNNDSENTTVAPVTESKLKLYKFCENHCNIANLLFASLLIASPIFNIIISVVISEKLIKSNISKTIFIIILSMIGVIMSLITDFFVNWVVIYTRQHNKTQVTADLIIFQSNSNDKLKQQKNNKKKNNGTKSIISAGFRSFSVSIASVSYIIVTQLMQNESNKNTLISLTCVLSISSIIQVINVVLGCIDYKSTMTEIDNNINIVIKALELIKITDINISERIAKLNKYKEQQSNNSRHYLYGNIAIGIFLFVTGEVGNLSATLLKKYDIIDQNLSLIITILSFSMALISSLTYAFYRSNIIKEQTILTDKITELASEASELKNASSHSVEESQEETLNIS